MCNRRVHTAQTIYSTVHTYTIIVDQCSCAPVIMCVHTNPCTYVHQPLNVHTCEVMDARMVRLLSSTCLYLPRSGGRWVESERHIHLEHFRHRYSHESWQDLPVNATTACRREADITRRDWKIETDNEPSFPPVCQGDERTGE